MAVSETFKRAVYSAQTDKVFLLLLRIEHAMLPEPILVVHNGEKIVSNGETYQACAFNLTLPTDMSESPPRATIAINNVGTVMVDGEEVNLVHELRKLRGKPNTTISVVLSADRDVVEHGPLELQLTGGPFDEMTVSGDLAYEDDLNEPIPADDYTPANYQGLYP